MSAPNISKSMAKAAEDYALTSVPQAERKNGYELALSPVGVATALLVFAIGGYAVMLGGFWVGLLAGSCVAVLGFVLGKLVGEIAFIAGLSSTLASRFYGFGSQGSSLASLVFAFMILGFLALESALLYQGTLLMFNLEDTMFTRISIYGILTVAWTLLAIFGLNLALRSSGIMIVVTLGVTFYLIYLIFFIQGNNFFSVFSFDGIVPGSSWNKFQASFALMGGTAGTIALLSSDFARYCRTSKDVTILAFFGPLVQSVIILVLGALIVIGSLPQITAYLMLQDPSMTDEAAKAAAGGFAMGNTGAYYVILAGWAGFITIYAAQAKAQAINAYSGSLALVNIFDTLFGKRPGRAVMVIVGNLIALLMISADILGQFTAWISYLGCMTLGLCGVMISDFYIVRRKRPHSSTDLIEKWNWAGVITLISSTIVGAYLIKTEIFPLGFMLTFVISIPMYWVVRKLMPHGTGTAVSDSNEALSEAH